MTHDGRPAVVLVHGLWNTVNIFWRLRAYLEAKRWGVYAVVLTLNNGDMCIERQAQQLKKFFVAALASAQPFYFLVCRSGWWARRYYYRLFACPHRG